jgi:hypothetical protein
VDDGTRIRAAERLGDLQGWALREISWMLRDKLYILRTRLESAPAVQEPWARSRNTTIDGLPTGV